MSCVCCKALCDSGIDYRGSNTGVFYAQLLNSVEDLEDDRYEINSYHGVGRPIAIRSNRISFTFDLRGQSIALDTACSSSATAMHLAMSAISLGDIDQALIVGTYVLYCGLVQTTELLKGGSTIINPKQMISVSKLGVLSSTGSSKSFDASADGYAR
jgi:acyl transferase domain-containing protein